MPTEAAISSSSISSATGFGASDWNAITVTWQDKAWQALVGRVDVILRRCYGIREFTNDPECVLRVGLGESRFDVSLADGTEIRKGEPIGIFHFWNEHLPRFPTQGPDLRWAKIMRRRVEHSLAALAEYVERDDVWQGVRGFRAESSFCHRLQTCQVKRVVGRYGFELLSVDPTPLHSVHALGENFLLWGFARAFNPIALRRRQRFLRPRQELWLSRHVLMQRYAGFWRQLPPR